MAFSVLLDCGKKAARVCPSWVPLFQGPMCGRSRLCEFSLRSKEPAMGCGFSSLFVCVVCARTLVEGIGMQAWDAKQVRATFRREACMCAAIVVGKVFFFFYFLSCYLACDSWFHSWSLQVLNSVMHSHCALCSIHLSMSDFLSNKRGRKWDRGVSVKICMNCWTVDCDLQLSSPESYSPCCPFFVHNFIRFHDFRPL